MTNSLKNILFIWLVPIAFTLAIVIARFGVGNLLFHSLAEVLTIIVGITITIVSYFTYRFTKNNFLLYLGIGYFWVAIIDLFHTLTFKDMMIYEINETNITLTFWILARFLEVFILLTAPFIQFHTLGKVRIFLLFGLFVSFVYWFTFSDYSPPLFIEGVGLTAIKIISEYVIIFLLSIAAFIFYKKKNIFDSLVYKYMMISIFLSILSEYTFTLYADIHGLIIMLGHVLKFLSFWLIFLAIIKTSLEKPFIFLSQEATTYNTIPFPVIVVDKYGSIRQMNNSTESFLGLKKEDILSKPNHELFHNKNVNKTECDICKAAENGDKLEFFELQKDDLTYSFTVTPIKVSNILTGSVQVCIDVTEHKRAEVDLKNSQNELATIINNEPECVKVVDLEGNLVSMNPAGLDMLQTHSLEDAQSRPLLSYVAPSSKDDFMELHKKVTQDGENSHLEFEVIGVKGKKLWLETNAVPMRSETGEITGLLGITRDITERKAYERELKKFKIAMEQSPTSIIITNPDADIEYVNPQFLKITGYEYEEVIGLNPRIVSSGYTTTEEYAEMWDKLSNKKETWAGVFKNKKKNGDTFWESAIISPIVDETNNVINYIGIKQDITEKVALENLVKSQEKLMLLQARHAAMGEMISMIAHQWRQPLGAISATAINLRLKIELGDFDLTSESGIDEANKYLLNEIKHISEYTENLSSTIDDFRNFYKPDKKSVNMSLKTVVDKALAIIKSSLNTDSIDVITEYKSVDEINVYDSELMQVLLNIIKNSQDTLVDNHIEEPYIKIIVDANIIHVCDNGGGVRDDIIDKIFDPYFSTKDEKNGTGIGLYMSKTIVEEHHNGRLSVENLEDGACFKIEIGIIE